MPMVKLVADFKKRSVDNVDSIPFFTCEIIFPSTIVRHFFSINEHLPVHDFVEKARLAMREANEKVKEKYGFSCFGCTYYDQKLCKMLERKDLQGSRVLVREMKG